MDTFQDYDPTQRFTNVNYLLGNHFRFVLTDLPDLSFYVQSVIQPDLTAASPKWPNPFTQVSEPGDHLTFGPLRVTYLMDAAAKTYFSLFYWMKGYGFPESYADIASFEASRRAQLANPRPSLREILKTHGHLSILRPDSDQSVLDIHFTDVFPVSIGQMTLTTMPAEPPKITCEVTFLYTYFDVKLIETS